MNWIQLLTFTNLCAHSYVTSLRLSDNLKGFVSLPVYATYCVYVGMVLSMAAWSLASFSEPATTQQYRTNDKEDATTILSKVAPEADAQV